MKTIKAFPHPQAVSPYTYYRHQAGRLLMALALLTSLLLWA